MATIYERVGGHAAVVAVIDGLYAKILANPVTAAAFVGRDVNHTKAMQVELFSHTLGSGIPYTGREMIPVHTGLHITKEQFDLVAGFLLATLNELHVDQEIVNTIMTFAASLEPQIINL
ncbi:unnamed protein product [Blepharisma stoltei]|uniref:Group 1 truncated hemoglobin n=1 Tax=Blepharisma stoltei TaxID=1481888 RepID=A0AAU9K427_9CILI|nr:unnamed protein product [Blepharisma stoltei]